MQFTTHPWPLSELSPDEAARIAAMPPNARNERIRKLKADLCSGEHARRERNRAIDAANANR